MKQNTTTHLWAKRGSRPLAVKQQQFEYAYLFGAVCVTNGASEAMIVPYVNKEIMRSHFQQISDKTASDRHAVIIVDGASWHGEDLADDFKNLTVIKLPEYSTQKQPNFIFITKFMTQFNQSVVENKIKFNNLLNHSLL